MRGASFTLILTPTMQKDRHPHSPFFYQLLRAWGAFGQDAPAAMRMLASRGKPTCEQLIGRYGIGCQPVRDVLVGYLRERQPSMDFSSLQRVRPSLRISVSVAGTPLATESITACITALPCF